VCFANRCLFILEVDPSYTKTDLHWRHITFLSSYLSMSKWSQTGDFVTLPLSLDIVISILKRIKRSTYSTTVGLAYVSHLQITSLSIIKIIGDVSIIDIRIP